MEKLNVEIKALLDSRADELGEDRKEFNFSDLILKMPVSQVIKSKLKHVKHGLELCKKNVFTAAMANKKYVQESLVVINDIFSNAVQVVNEKQYSYSGQLLDSNDKPSLINTEV